MIRSAGKGELKFILAVTLRKIRKGVRGSKDDFYPRHEKLFFWILRRPGVRVLVDAHPEGFIRAFLIAEPSQRVLHFAYTRNALRRQGLFARLVAEAFHQGSPDVCTHAPPAWLSPDLAGRFNPYWLAWELAGDGT